MKHIQKQSPPTELVAYRNTPGASYQDLFDNHHDTWELTRLSLAEEQGYICCYCGQRITGFEGTVIEHIFPKGTAEYAGMQLDYENNLIASCDGGKYRRRQNPNISLSDLHCDTNKDSTPIPINPLDSRCENMFMYDSNGDIYGDGATAEATITILNLRSPILKNRRKAAIDAFSYQPNINWKEKYAQLNTKNEHGEYTEFCFVLRSYIEIFHASEI